MVRPGEPQFNQTIFPSAEEDMVVSARQPNTSQTRSASYRLAHADTEFLSREELRPVRLQLELLKPELVLQELGIESTVVIFGGSRIPDRHTATQRLAKRNPRVG